MTDASQAHRRWALLAVKAVHSGVFLVELASLAWLVVTGVSGRRDRTVGVAAALVAAEAAVFVANDGVCPLTPMAERLGSSSGGVSDIFLPGVVARTIPIWSTGLVALGLLLHARGAWRSRGESCASTACASERLG